MVNKCAADKENVPLALAVIHERPFTKQRLLQLEVTFQIEEKLPVFQKCVTIGGLFQTLTKDFRQIYRKCCDQQGQKTEFLRALADQIEQWFQSPTFTLTPQTVSALTTTRRAHAMLIEDLLNDVYQYVITARLQSHPVERFSQHRRINGGRFLVNLRNSEKILQCCSLIKENINFWEEDLTSENEECVTVTRGIFGT